MNGTETGPVPTVRITTDCAAIARDSHVTPVSPVGRSGDGRVFAVLTLRPRAELMVLAAGQVRLTVAAVGVGVGAAVGGAVAGALVDAGEELPVDAEPQAISIRPAKEIA